MPRYSKEEIRRERARRSFIHFLEDYVYISDPIRGKIKYEVWPHLEELSDLLKDERLIVWLKARQIGASWTVAAYGLWTCLYNKGAKVLMFSQGEDEAMKLLSKCKFIYEHLPEKFRPKTTSDNMKSMTFGEGWYIQAFPSTQHAGRSETASLIIYDEADFHEYLEASYNATKPTIDDVGGQMLMISTANPYKSQSLFKQIFRAAPDNGFHPVFYAYNVRPNRTTEWYESTRKTYTDPFLFQKEYPNNATEALAPPREVVVFDFDVLQEMEKEAKEPIETLGKSNIYQKMIPGRKYVAATDVAHGVGLDSSVTVVIDLQTGMVVADLVSRFMEESEFAVESVRLLRNYSYPVWAIESNESGRAVIDRAKLLDYPRLFHHKKGDAGWRTSSANRGPMWANLIEAVHARTLVIPNKDGIKEFYEIIRRPDKDGRIAAEEGGHDDYPMALAIALSIKDHAVKSEWAATDAPKQKSHLWKWR